MRTPKTQSAEASGHTAGPWSVVEATEHHGFYVTNDFGNTICDLYAMTRPDMPSTANGGPSKPVPFMHEMDGPNARLIAAAPSLLNELDVCASGLHMLRRAIVEGDPKAELLVRIDDMLRETSAAITLATPSPTGTK